MKQQAVIDTLWQLYEEIKHGDDEHREWLRIKFDNFIFNLKAKAIRESRERKIIK